MNRHHFKPVRALLGSLTLLGVLLLSGCVAIAPFSPMVTFGGPETTEKGVSEVVTAAGTGLSFFDKARISEQGFLGSYRVGVHRHWDVGADVMGYITDTKWVCTGKVSTRFQLLPFLRGDVGVGLADNSFGSAINGDVGLTAGTIRTDRVWNVYGSVRYGYAYGMKGSVINRSYDGSIYGKLTNGSAVMANVGAEARVTPYLRFLFEGGAGQVFPNGIDSGTLAYLSAGFKFRIPHHPRRKKDAWE